MTLNLVNGWNMISSFGHTNSLSEMLPADILGDISAVFNYNGTSYDSVSVTDNLEQGKAYWVYSTSERSNISLDLTTSENEVTIELTFGWNMVGAPFSADLEIAPLDFVSSISAIFAYNGVSYDSYDKNSDSFVNGLGYWVYSTSDSPVSVIVSSGTGPQPEPEPEPQPEPEPEPQPEPTLPNLATDIEAKYEFDGSNVIFSLKSSTGAMIQASCVELDTYSTTADSLVDDVSGGIFYNFSSPGTTSMGFGRGAFVSLDKTLTSDWEVIATIPYATAPKVVQPQIVNDVPLPTDDNPDQVQNLIMGTCVSKRETIGTWDDGSDKYADFPYAIPVDKTTLVNMEFAPTQPEPYDASAYSV